MAVLEDLPTLETLTDSTLASGDFIIVYDVSARRPKKMTIAELNTYLEAT